MSKKDIRNQDQMSESKAEDQGRRELLARATKLAAYTAPVLFTLSGIAAAASKPERSGSGRPPKGKSAPGRRPPDQTMSLPPPPPPPEPPAD